MKIGIENKFHEQNLKLVNNKENIKTESDISSKIGRAHV